MKKTPIVLIIMDGYGLGEVGLGNAVSMAKTPVLDALTASCPKTTLSASGTDVGLPAGQIGNSEVGHTNIGAGRVVFQDLPRISNAVEDGSFFQNAAFISAMDSCQASGGALHLMGLLSDGGVHSHETHLWALLELARRRGLNRVYIHCFMDGRDVPPSSGKAFVAGTAEKCAELGVGKIATVMGRYFAMDRDSRWDRLTRAYKAMVLGEGKQISDPVIAMQESYDNGVTDEFVEPIICDPEGMIKSGDSIIFFNFRPDRAREITRALTDPDFDHFDRPGGCLKTNFVCFTRYDEQIHGVSIAFPPEELTGTLGEYLSELGLRQLRIAETEKYAHVTFFLNGGEERVFEGEDRVLVPSPRDVNTYDLKPEMSAPSVAGEAVSRIESGDYDVVILNFANCDMVGHTGVFDAAVKAVETVDTCVGKVLTAVRDMGGIALVTADHGNADRMLYGDGKPYTAHTTNPVPLIIAGADVRLRPGRLADIAPTMLELMGLKKPDKMTGQSLIVH